MDSDQIARVIYLVLLLSVIGGYFLVANRGGLGRMAQQAAIWGLIFVGAIAVAGLWGDIRRDVSGIPRQQVIGTDQIVVPRAPDGHFYLNAEVNGKPVLFVVDTGATDIALSQSDARRVGLDPAGLAYLGTAQTANGVVATAPVRLDSVAVGPFTDTGVRAMVTKGDLGDSLLGMSYLRRYEMTMNGDRMVLRR
jgi:aspartyl protease family protein